MADKEDDSIEDLFPKKGININFLGVPVKLDLFSTVIGLATAGAALGTGYLLYNDFQNKNEKTRIEQERLKQIQQMNYMRQLEYNRQRQMSSPHPTAPNPTPPQSPQPTTEDESKRIDMSYYNPPPPEAPRKLSYAEILTQSEQANPNNPTSYMMQGPMQDYNATFPSRHSSAAVNPPTHDQYITPTVDMSKMISNSPPPSPSPQQPSPQEEIQRTPLQRTQAAEEEQLSAQTQEEINDLYKSMNNY